MEKIKEFISDHFLDFVIVGFCALFFLWGGWLLYTANRTANDYRGTAGSVEHVEAGIDSAGKRLESAQTEIKNAQKHIQRADETAGKLTERTRRNAEELDDCQRITDRMSERSERIQRIIADVEKANKTDGTQADGNP